MSKHAEALQLAAIVDRQGFFDDNASFAAAEKLKEQHALIVEMLAALNEADYALELEGYKRHGATRKELRAAIAKAESHT